MTQSMTAFARVDAAIDGMNFSWELRSVNHRYLDASFRLPDAWRFLETDLRSSLRGQVQRGKVECQLKVLDNSVDARDIRINHELVDTLLAATDALADSRQLQNDITLSSLLAWPGIVQFLPRDVEQLAPSVLKLFHDALMQLQAARASEGAALQQHVQQRLNLLRDEISKARALCRDHALTTRDKILTRLSALAIEVDSGRLEQEIALILTRLDVSEELDRLDTHVVEIEQALASSEPVGRRLDFLMQELNREANTLSSKSDSASLTQCAVEMKVLIEQMREQIQNLE